MSHPATKSAPGSDNAGLGPTLTFLFALSCGALAANLYYAQPLVSLIGADIGLPVAAESSIVTLSQIGYAIGLVFLVPLGDLLENRTLILVTMAANVVSLAGLALAPGLAALFAGMLVVGATSCAAQMLVPLAANLAPEEERGAIVGNVMSGLLGGILLARPISSFLADYVGWRGVFGLSAGLIAILAVASLALLPRRVPAGERGYWSLIRSLGKLFIGQAAIEGRRDRRLRPAVEISQTLAQPASVVAVGQPLEGVRPVVGDVDGRIHRMVAAAPADLPQAIDRPVAGDRGKPGDRTGAAGIEPVGPPPDGQIDVLENVLGLFAVVQYTQADAE